MSIVNNTEGYQAVLLEAARLREANADLLRTLQQAETRLRAFSPSEPVLQQINVVILRNRQWS